MKKLLLMLFMGFLLLPVANAQGDESEGTDATVTEETTEETDAGLTPDSPLYFIDKALEKLNLALTFDDAAKTEKLLEYAKERIAEAEEMNEEEKMEYIEELILEYMENINEASDNLVDLSEDEGEEIEAKLDETITESDELSEKLDVDLAQKLEEKKGTAYIKFSALREALQNIDNEELIKKANEAEFGLGELSKMAIGANILGISLEEVLDAVIEAGSIEKYFETHNIKISDLILKGVELKQEKLQAKLATAIENGNEKAVKRIERQIAKSIDREAKHAILDEYKEKRREILSQYDVEDLDELDEETKEAVKEQLKELKTESKEQIKAIKDEKKEEVKKAIKEVKENRSRKEKVENLKEKIADKIKEKVKERNSKGKNK